MSSRTWRRLHVFQRLTQLHVLDYLPRLALVACFPALGTVACSGLSPTLGADCMFSSAWHSCMFSIISHAWRWLHVFSRLVQIVCFSVFDTCSTASFACARQRSHAFPPAPLPPVVCSRGAFALPGVLIDLFR